MLDQIRERINAAILADPNMNRGFEFRMSTAGDCVRKLEYDSQLGRGDASIESALRMNMGEPIHAMWRNIFRMAYGDDYAHVEEEIKLDLLISGTTLVIPGHPDGAILKLDCITEVKGCSDSTFTMVKKRNKPLDAHSEQGNIYAHVLKKKFILFLYQNRDSGEYLLLWEEYSLLAAMAVIEKWEIVFRHKEQYGRDKSVVLSPRPYNDMSESPCWFCEWKHKCYAGYAEKVASMASRESTDEKIVSLGDKLNSYRNFRLETEKKEESTKTDIALWMLDNSVKQVKVPVGDLILKIGSENNPLVSLKPKKDPK